MPSVRTRQNGVAARIQKKTKEDKTKIIQDLTVAFSKYEKLYLFEVTNLKGTHMGRIRNELSGVVMISQAKKALVRVAFGASEENELAPKSSTIHTYIGLNRGLIFADMPLDEIRTTLAKFNHPEYNKPGSISTRTVVIEPGILRSIPDPRGKLPPPQDPEANIAMLEYLRSLDVKCEMSVCEDDAYPDLKGKPAIFVLAKKVICVEGEPITPQAYRLLQLLAPPDGQFGVSIIGEYRRGEGMVLFD